MTDVLGFGHCCVDYLCVCDPFPEKGKKGIITHMHITDGGPVPTALKVLSKYGIKTRFCGKVGNDDNGRIVHSSLHRAGVSTDILLIDDSVITPRACIWIDPHDGSRTVALSLENYRWVTPAEFSSHLPLDCKIFLTDNRAPETILPALHDARSQKIPTVLDAGSYRPGTDRILPFTDYAIVSSDFYDSLPKANSQTNETLQKAEVTASFLVHAGADTAIVTMGEHGAFCMSPGNSVTIPAFDVEVVDTTGAGDIFHGGFIYGLLRKWPLMKSICFANAAAALSCREISASGGIPQLNEVEGLLISSGKSV